MLKILGMILVFISSTLGGFYFASKDTYRIKDLKEIKKALKMLEGEIIYARNEMNTAFDNISCRIPYPISKIFSDVFQDKFSNEFSDKRDILIYDENIKELWINSLERNQKNTFLNTQDIEYLKGIGDLLGYLDVDTQKNALEIYILHIDDEIKLLNESKDKNMKMYQSLGILTGLLVIILFI